MHFFIIFFVCSLFWTRPLVSIRTEAGQPTRARPDNKEYTFFSFFTCHGPEEKHVYTDAVPTHPPVIKFSSLFSRFTSPPPPPLNEGNKGMHMTQHAGKALARTDRGHY